MTKKSMRANKGVVVAVVDIDLESNGLLNVIIAMNLDILEINAQREKLQDLQNQGNRGRGAEARASGSSDRVFVVSGGNVGENTDRALDGMVLISSIKAHVLFDTGTSETFVFKCSIRIWDVVDRTYRSCHLLVNNPRLTADLYSLGLKKYDLILGMDWLRKHHAIIDCEERKFKVCTLEAEEVIIKLDEKIVSPSPLLKASYKTR
ncbi:hypothetical protein EV1_000060 [Malus domestica]